MSARIRLKNITDTVQMSEPDSTKFDRWCESVAGQMFNFKKQLAMYCKNDVVLLREGCIKYRKEFIESTNVDPFGCVPLAGCAIVTEADFTQRVHSNAQGFIMTAE